MSELVRFAVRYRRREARLSEQLRELNEQRDEEIRKAAEAGIPATEIARLLGLSHQRVSEIIRGL
jgi:DNA invertase Pin-like site-specific DNA recombinase